MDCPFYARERHKLQRKLCRNAGSLSFLLSSPDAVLPLLKFVHATGRFKSFFGKDPKDKILTNSRKNAEIRQAAVGEVGPLVSEGKTSKGGKRSDNVK